MIVAIYARKSTKDNKAAVDDADGSKTHHDIAEEARSVPRQIEGAKAFIASKGWTVCEANVYKDDGVSGVLFENRAEFQRMMRDATTGAFEAIVFYDLDRFGRHAHKTMVALNALADLGIDVWDFSTGVRVDLESFEGRLAVSLRAEFAQQYREQVRKHTTFAMRRKAEQGFVTGGRVFGYDNVRISPGQTDRVKNEAEAAIVREIYTRFAMGEGARTIAMALNTRGVPSIRAQQGRPSGWGPSTIRAVLERPLYRGELVYGRTASAYGRELGPRRNGRESGSKKQPEETWIRREVPHLRIIDADLASRCDERRNDRRRRYLDSVKRGDGRVPERAHGKYLLSGGMLICPQCGGHFEGRLHPWKGNPGEVYSCSTRRRKPGMCTNTLALPIAKTDKWVLAIIEDEVLSPRFIDELLALVDGGQVDDTDQLTAERDRLRTEIQRLVKSIADGVPEDAVVAEIKDRQAQVTRLETKLRTPRPEPPNIERLRDALVLRAKEWKKDLRAEPKVARLLLRRLVEPLVLWEPRPGRVHFSAPATPALLDGLTSTLVGTSPPGIVDVYQVPLRGNAR